MPYAVRLGRDGAPCRRAGTVTIGFQLVRHTAKEESPLVQLKTNGVIITTIADVTFYGRDQVGNDISATGIDRNRLRQLRG